MSIDEEHQPTYSSAASTYTSIAQRPSYTLPTAGPSLYSTSYSQRPSLTNTYSSSVASPTTYRSLASPAHLAHSDPFSSLRSHHLRTKFEWTVITPSEGFAILDHCKSLSQASENSNMIPCYNRETLFDEEWQDHMREVHGVYLIWPETWMKRVEVLDLEAGGLGGRIERANDVVMEGRTSGGEWGDLERMLG